MSLWSLLDGGYSMPARKTLGQRLCLWAGHLLATRRRRVIAHRTSLISPEARICPRQGLIEIGADILRPQFSCLDIREMAALTKGKVTMVMDLDRQYILPFGTPYQVREHVKDAIDVFGLPEGGLVGRGETMPDVPLENAKAMLDALVEYGRL